MPVTDFVKNTAINAVTATMPYASLLDLSLTEIAGGSPAYARKAINWSGSAASGADDNTGAIVFDVQSGDTIGAFGLESASSAGTQRGWWPLGGYPLQTGIVTASTDVIAAVGHGLTTDNRVVFMDIGAAGLPTGLTEGVFYYVLASGLTADAFKVSTTSGGSSAAITTDGEAFFVRADVFTYSSQGTYTFADGDMDIAATLL